MDFNSSYCEAINSGKLSEIHIAYHDFEFGRPVSNDDELFGYLILEINQAGLSWDTIMKKRKLMRVAYSNFSIQKIANYKEKDILRLLNDSNVIRMRKKIESIIYNANKILELKKEFGSFLKWLDFHHPKKIVDWIKLFKATFKFVGKEMTNEFLISTGYLQGAHSPNCPFYKEVIQQKPKWSENN